MNNNLYRWHDEQMVKHEMEQVRLAAEQARLLKEAGLSRPSLLARAIKFLQDLLKARRETVRVPRALRQSLIRSSRKTECKS